MHDDEPLLDKVETLDGSSACRFCEMETSMSVVGSKLKTQHVCSMSAHPG
jgi:hypothetical protein